MMKITLLSTALTLSFFTASSFGQIILNSNGGDWDDPVWGPSNEVATAGNDYLVNNTGGAFDLDLPGGGDALITFPGDSLTIGTGSRADFKQDGNANWILQDGGTLRHTTGDANFSIGGTLQIASGGGTIDINNGFFTVAAMLTGSAPLSVTGGRDTADGALFSGGGSYSGTIDFSSFEGATLDFEANYEGADLLFGALTDYDHGSYSTTYDLNSSDVFRGFTLNGTSLAPGTYNFTDLSNEGLGAFFTDNSGTVTIIPEPSAAVLFLGTLSLLAARRRRSR